MKKQSLIYALSLAAALACQAQQQAGFSAGGGLSLHYASMGQGKHKTHTDLLPGARLSAAGHFPLGKHQMEMGLSLSMEGYRFRLGEYFGDFNQHALMRIGYVRASSIYRLALPSQRRRGRYDWQPALHLGAYYNVRLFSRWRHPGRNDLWNTENLAITHGGAIIGAGWQRVLHRRHRHRAIGINAHYKLGLSDMLNHFWVKGYARELEVGVQYFWLQKPEQRPPKKKQ